MQTLSPAAQSALKVINSELGMKTPRFLREMEQAGLDKGAGRRAFEELEEKKLARFNITEGYRLTDAGQAEWEQGFGKPRGSKETKKPGNEPATESQADAIRTILAHCDETVIEIATNEKQEYNAKLSVLCFESLVRPKQWATNALNTGIKKGYISIGGNEWLSVTNAGVDAFNQYCEKNGGIEQYLAPDESIDKGTEINWKDASLSPPAPPSPENKIDGFGMDEMLLPETLVVAGHLEQMAKHAAICPQSRNAAKVFKRAAEMCRELEKYQCPHYGTSINEVTENDSE